jgi:chemotaxis protein MotB
LRNIFRSAGDRVEISPGAGAVTVRLRDTITFDSASADLLPNVRPLLGRVAEWLATHPEIALEISGHTDDVPIATPRYPSNWELSAARAAAVARQLLEGTAIDPGRTHIAGYGEHHPLTDVQGNHADRGRNRRVEIRFLLPVNPTS